MNRALELLFDETVQQLTFYGKERALTDKLQEPGDTAWEQEPKLH